MRNYIKKTLKSYSNPLKDTANNKKSIKKLQQITNRKKLQQNNYKTDLNSIPRSEMFLKTVGF